MSEHPSPAPTSPRGSHPASPAEAARGRRGPWCWLVALLSTALLVVASSGLVAFAQTGGGTAAGPSFLPVGTPIYLEVRADLPSGQDDALAQMMTAFPGFADPAMFPMKVDEALDGLLAEATTGMLSWTGDIRTWFSGQVSMGITAIPEDVSGGGSDDMPFLVGLSLSDATAFDATIARLMEMAGSDAEEAVTTVEHQGSTITVAPDLAFVALDDLVLASNDVDQVRLGLDVLAGAEPSLATSTAFQTAIARVPDAHLHAGWVSFEAFAPLIREAVEAGGASGLDPSMLDQLPVDMTWYLAANADGATFEAFLTPGEGAPALPLGESDLAASFPAGTQVYLEAREVGDTIRAALEQLRAQMGEEAADLEGLEQMLGAPLEELLEWADDIAIGAGFDGSALWLGLAAEVSDSAAASERVTSLLALVRLLASQSDGAVVIETTDVDGVSVTTIRVSAEGLDEELPLPIDTSLSVALDGDRFLLGIGDFVTDALQLAPESSLGGDARYASGVAGLGTPNGGYLYADLAGLRAAFEPLLAFSMPEYEDVAPFIEPFDRLVAGSRMAGDVPAMTVRLYVR
jgi:hypothetical protein